VGIMSVRSDRDAVTLMNDSDFGLTASWIFAHAVKPSGINASTTVFKNFSDKKILLIFI